MKHKQQSKELPFIFEVVVREDNLSYFVELNKPKTGKYKVDYYGRCNDPNCIFLKKRYRSNFKCFFKKAGVYRISLYGSFPGLNFYDYVRPSWEYNVWGCIDTVKEKQRTREEFLKEYAYCYTIYLKDIIAWGTNIWRRMDNMFSECMLMDISATDAPDLRKIKSLDAMFKDCRYFNGNIGHWDVSNIKSMCDTFRKAYHFNKPLEQWDVSNVKNMDHMFTHALSFNQPLNRWNVSRTEYMEHMFSSAMSFNQPLDRWNVSHVKDMWGMFAGAYDFTQSLDKWNVFSVIEDDCSYLGGGGFEIDGIEMVAVHGRIVREKAYD